jgi:hypothetical protein
VLTAQWPVVRWSLFALGSYALLWVVGFGLSLRQRPHLLRADELVLRFGTCGRSGCPCNSSRR